MYAIRSYYASRGMSRRGDISSRKAPVPAAHFRFILKPVLRPFVIQFNNFVVLAADVDNGDGKRVIEIVITSYSIHYTKLYDIPLEAMDGLARQSIEMVKLGSFCTVFSGTEVLENIRRGKKVSDIVKGLFYSVIKRVIEMDAFTDTVVMIV